MEKVLKKRISLGTLYLVLAVIVFWTVFPMYWTFQASFADKRELYLWPPKPWPPHPTLINYLRVFFESRIPAAIINSLFVAVTSALIITFLSSFAGYALSRIRRYRTSLLFVFLATQMLPSVLLVIPLFIIWHETGLIDTYFSLIFTYSTLFMPFCILLMRGFFAEVPYELEEAAMVDGCGRLQAVFRIVFPVVLPGLAATMAFAFVVAWNEFILALIFINSPDKMTLPVALNTCVGQMSIELGALYASGMLALIPAIALFCWMQRYLIRGLASGAVKG